MGRPNKSNVIVKRLVQARLEKQLKRKLIQQDRIIRANQKELREFVLTRKDKLREDRVVKPDEIISLGYDSPYMVIEGARLWGGPEA